MMLSGVAQSNENEDSAFLFEYRRSLFAWAAELVSREVQEVTWKCFWMTAVEDRSSSDVAQAMDVSVGTVYTAKCRVVARIREKVAQFSEVDEASLFNDGALAGHLFAMGAVPKINPTENKEE